MNTRSKQFWFMISMTALMSSLGSCFTGKNIPPFPENSNALIEEVKLQDSTPDWHLGRLDTVNNDELSIHFESIGDEKNPTVLFIMGYGTSGLAWSTGIIQPFLDADYHVIRFDNRDTGRSRWRDGMEPKNGDYYTLSDMAKDACRILDKLGKEKAHLVGISMGGMIAQELAINHPERVHSMTCIASTGHFFDRELVSVSGKVIQANAEMILKYGAKPKSFVKEVKKRTSTVAFLQSPQKIDEAFLTFVAQRLLFKKKNNYINHPKADKRHGKAIRKSGSRLDLLRQLEMPVLLIHGKQDLLIWHQHTEKYAKLIKNSKEVYFDNMGHIPTEGDDKRISSEILNFISAN